MQSRIHFTRTSLILFICLLSFGFTACAPIQPLSDTAPAATTTALTPLKVCYSSATATQAVVLYAYEKGLFQQYGLDVELVYIEGGSTATAALIAGEVDVCQVAGTAVINSVVAGSDLALIAGLFNTYLFSLVVRPEIQTPADLQGQAVAISEPGSSSDAAMRAILASLDVMPDQDVTLVATGGQGARLAAMESGAVAGTVVSVTETDKALAAGYRELVAMDSLQTPFPHTALATSRQFIADNHATVQHFMAAILTAIAQMKQDQPGVTAVLAQYLSLDPEKDADTLAKAYTILIQKNLPDLPYPTLEGIQAQLHTLAAENPAAANVKPEAIVDTSLLAELQASGFLQQVGQQ